jgi:hypothetical protein
MTVFKLLVSCYWICYSNLLWTLQLLYLILCLGKHDKTQHKGEKPLSIWGGIKKWNTKVNTFSDVGKLVRDSHLFGKTTGIMSTKPETYMKHYRQVNVCTLLILCKNFCNIWQNILTFQSLAVSLRTTRFKIKKFYMLFAMRWVFCRDLRTDSDLCFICH